MGVTGYFQVMKFLKVALILVFGAMTANCEEEASFDSVDGPNVRVTKHEDGSRTVFTRSPDNRVLKKNTFTANGVLFLVTIYRMDAHGNPLNCKIYDGKKNEMFKSRYGYHNETGLLVEEQMFDSRVKRTDPNTGQEMPVRRFIYNYDALGNRSAPISITLTPGKTAEEVYEQAVRAGNESVRSPGEVDFLGNDLGGTVDGRADWRGSGSRRVDVCPPKWRGLTDCVCGRFGGSAADC